MSDLHLELDRKFAPVDVFRISSPDSRVNAPSGPCFDGLAGAVDLVLLAGDVDSKHRGVGYANILAGYLGVPVVYVAGNHEFYGSHLGLPFELERAAAQMHGVFYLENSRIEFEMKGRHVVVLGATLWTDFALLGQQERERCMQEAEQTMSDYQAIHVNPPGRLLRPADTAELHAASRAWLEQQLAEVDADATVIVVTHHAPSLQSVALHERAAPISAAYASNLEAMLQRCGPHLWVHGHTHCRADYRVASTRVVSNPCGYPHQRVADRPLVLSV
jgi:predicted phosphodiesterase